MIPTMNDLSTKMISFTLEIVNVVVNILYVSYMELT